MYVFSRHWWGSPSADLSFLYFFFFFRKGHFYSHTLLFQVDMSKVNADSLKPWIASRITELLGMEDDVVVEFVYNQLDARVRLICLFSLFWVVIETHASLFTFFIGFLVVNWKQWQLKFWFQIQSANTSGHFVDLCFVDHKVSSQNFCGILLYTCGFFFFF